MKKMFLPILGFASFITVSAQAQDVKASQVPEAAKTSCMKKFPEASKISWEIENGNYEANWGGKSGEDNSAQFTPAGAFVELEVAIPVSSLPSPVFQYCKSHKNYGAIKEAGKITDASGKITYEAEVKAGDLIFNEQGNFVRLNTGD